MREVKKIPSVVSIEGFYSDLRWTDRDFGFPTLMPYVPHRFHPASQIVATIHRFGRLMPATNPILGASFLDFVKYATPRIWPNRPTNQRSYMSEFIADSNYPGRRKAELMEVWALLEQIEKKMAKSQSFVKWESYEEPKNARAINALIDKIKVIFGPIFHEVDEMTYACGNFVKGKNPRDWPDLLETRFGHSPVSATDFSSFEAHHRGVFSKAVVFWMMHMTRKLSRFRMIRKLLRALVLGVNTSYFSYIKVVILQRLMSGAPWTSSANGFLNMMITMFLAAHHVTQSLNSQVLYDWVKANFRGVFEGDDGLCVDYHVPKQLCDDMGLILKPTPYPDYSVAGFCSIYCDRSSGTVLQNPLKILRKFFLLDPRYLKQRKSRQLALLRAKAMSLLVNFSASPVISAMAHFVLRKTKKIDVRTIHAELDERQRSFLDIAIREKPWLERRMIPDTSRKVVEQCFGVPVETQRAIEKAFDTAETGIVQLSLSEFSSDDDFHHGLNFLFLDEKEWLPPSCKIPQVVLDVMLGGLVGHINQNEWAYNSQLTPQMLYDMDRGDEEVHLWFLRRGLSRVVH